MDSTHIKRMDRGLPVHYRGDVFTVLCGPSIVGVIQEWLRRNFRGLAMDAYEYNLTMSAEIVASQTTISISKARKLLKAGLYFGLGDLDAIEQIIIQKENPK
jgi:hypothetical protein